ncbi:MAG: PRTRC system protein C [Bryobacteraceae bacterium]|nr:PRTRC system protein C [Bryobacteraceae bacterium]
MAKRFNNSDNRQEEEEEWRWTMQTKAMRREFSFMGLKLPDPDPKMSVEDVRGILAMQYPEIATAAITGPEAVGDTMKYSFERAIGSKG